MDLLALGANHRTTAIDVRERLYVGREAVAPFLDLLRERDAISECVVLSTCNRTELYLLARDAGEAARVASDVLAQHAGLPGEEVESHLYRHVGREAVAHLFRVVSGLDSLLVGEPQIQGQVRDAYEAAREADPDHVGPVLHRLFQAALSAGGEVRDRTRISEGAATVPSAAVQLATKVFGSLQGRRAAVIGAGEMGEMTLDAFVARGIREVRVASRTLERARETADRHGVGSVAYERLLDELGELDIVVTSTSAPHPVLTVESMRRGRAGRSEPLVIVDIAVPRDVEPEVGDLAGVFLYNIDDLQRVVQSTTDERDASRTEAEELLREGTGSFWRWYLGRQAVPLIRGIREEAERIRREQIEEALAGIEGLSDEERAEIHRASRLALKKVLHAPTVGLRELAARDDGEALLEAARRLFAVDGEAARDGGTTTETEEDT